MRRHLPSHINAFDLVDSFPSTFFATLDLISILSNNTNTNTKSLLHSCLMSGFDSDEETLVNCVATSVESSSTVGLATSNTRGTGRSQGDLIAEAERRKESETPIFQIIKDTC